MRARDNPFRSELLLQVPYCLKNGTWVELLEHAAKLHYRAAIVGPRGSGKTTLLESLEPRLRELGFGTRFIRLDENQRRVESGFWKNFSSGLSSHDIILFDGAEQMDFMSWHVFSYRVRFAAGLIITLHRAARLPTLWECSTSPELLASIAAQLLDVETEAILDRAEELYSKHRGNLREALREWYDLVGGLPELPGA